MSSEPVIERIPQPRLSELSRSPNTARLALVLPGLLLLFGSLPTTPALAQDDGCDSGRRIEHAFASGATWLLCADVEESHGLSISSARYRAPGDTLRSVLQEAHLGQLLLHYHDSALPEAQIDPTTYPDSVDDSNDLISMNTNNCEGQVLDVPGHLAVLCSRIRNNGILAKYAQRPSIQSDSLELSSSFQRQALTWTTSVTFAEDGQIRPAVSLSGRATHTQTDPRFGQSIPATQTQALTRATVLATWRLVFDLDSPDVDRLEQFEFPLQSLAGNRRPMQVTTLDTEQFLTVDRASFRGWRMVDTTGAGYYLDPANNGFSYSNNTMPWTASDGAVTTYNECERHASGNSPVASDSAASCGASLDSFVNAQSLQGSQTVLWYSQSRTLDPRAEDWPVIRNLVLGFDLLPFDWTAASPFETNE